MEALEVGGRTRHRLYRLPPDRLLHVVIDPSASLTRSFGEREAIRADATVEGIPQVLARAENRGMIWWVEEWLPGASPSGPPESWFPLVANWLVRLAASGGPRLEDVPEWHQRVAKVVARSPEEIRPMVALAADTVGGVGATPEHGDFSPKNVLVPGRTVGAVDWEGARRHGVPGIDLVFLALHARDPLPDAGVIDDLVAGRDPQFGRVLDLLRQVGVGDEVRRSLLLFMLATWAADERDRGEQPGSRETARDFHKLLMRGVSTLTG